MSVRKAILALMIGAAAVPAAASMHSFTLTGAGYSGRGIITASGSEPNIYLCATCPIGPGEHVTSVTGTLNGDAISGPLPALALFGNNNHLYPGTGPYLDWGDLGFSAGGIGYNVFGGDYAGHAGYFLAPSTGGDLFAHPVTFTLDSPGGVPEPANWALMLLGLGGVGMALRAPRRRAVAA